MLKLRGIDHVVLRVEDIDVMRRFYCDILGATQQVSDLLFLLTNAAIR